MVLGISGCSVSQSLRPQTVKLILLPPGEGPEETLLKQKVTMQSAGLDQQFVAVLRLQRDRLKLAALMPSGQQIFYLEYDGEVLIQENTSSIDVPGRDILAIMQFALWPSSSVQQHYSGADDWFLDINAEQRTLLTGTDKILEVTYHSSSVVIVNHLHDYRLTVQPLENKGL